MKIPKADEDSKEFFKLLLPEDSRITIRPMFGNISAFINGNMFAGVFGEELFVRLSDDEKEELLANKGASLLEPMKGRPMKDYVVMPRIWRKDQATLRDWIAKALDSTSKLPPKEAKK